MCAPIVASPNSKTWTFFELSSCLQDKRSSVSCVSCLRFWWTDVCERLVIGPLACKKRACASCVSCLRFGELCARTSGVRGVRVCVCTTRVGACVCLVCVWCVPVCAWTRVYGGGVCVCSCLVRVCVGVWSGVVARSVFVTWRRIFSPDIHVAFLLFFFVSMIKASVGPKKKNGG